MIDWYNENELRQYPLYEHATAVSDRGDVLPAGLLVDLSVTVPEAYTETLRLALLRRVGTYVTVVLNALEGDNEITVLSYTGEAEPGQPLPMVPLVGGSSGLVAFGRDILALTGAYQFSTPAQSSLAVRTTHVERNVGPTALRGGTSSPWLYGLVTLAQAGAIRISYNGDGEIAVELAEGRRREFLSDYDRGPTGGECDLPPIRTVNGVGPDESGIVTLEVLPYVPA